MRKKRDGRVAFKELLERTGQLQGAPGMDSELGP